jgi:hypothetical protein
VRFTASGHGALVLDRTIELGPADAPLGAVFVNPGTHVVQLRNGEQPIAEQSFLAVAGASQQVQIGEPIEDRTRNLRASAGANKDENHASDLPKPFDGGASQPHARSVVPLFVGAGVSLGSFIVAGVLLNSANNHLNDAHALQSTLNTAGADGACLRSENAVACQQLHSALQSSDRRFNWSYAMFGLGGASLLATVTYALWPIFGGDSSKHVSNELQSIGIHASADTASVTWRGQF